MNPSSDPHQIVAVLLAAGRGKRFDPAGQQDKLLQRLPNGQLVATQAALNLKAVFERVIAVVRPGQQQLMQSLEDAGCETTVCIDADDGMASSLQRGLKVAGDAAGWLVALADMPFVQVDTLRRLRSGLEQGHQLVAPSCNGRRGNPVGIGSQHLAALLQLRGDQGARALLTSCPVELIDVSDPGIHQDIDKPSDLR